jgi:hypothetical protein
MSRVGRIVLVLVALAMVFGPRAVAATSHAEGPRQLTAAVLAPTTSDADAVGPAREVAPPLTLVAVLLTGVVGIVLVARRRSTPVEVPARRADPTHPRPPRRGPPRPLA